MPSATIVARIPVLIDWATYRPFRSLDRSTELHPTESKIGCVQQQRIVLWQPG